MLLGLFSSYETFGEFNQSGLDGVITYAAETVSFFVPLTLFALFLIAFLGTYLSQKRISGQSSFKGSFFVASFFITIVSFLMTLVEDLIDPIVMLICFGILTISIVILFISE